MLTLKWSYATGNEYDFSCNDSSKIGQLYRLKMLEQGVVKVELWSDNTLCLEWQKQEGDE
jgi:hypothetical protein